MKGLIQVSVSFLFPAILGSGLAVIYIAFNLYTNRNVSAMVCFGNLSFVVGVLGLLAWNAYFGKLDRVQLLVVAALAFFWTAMRTGRYLSFWNRRTRLLFLSFGYTSARYTLYLILRRAFLRLLWDFTFFLIIASTAFWTELVLYSRFYESVLPFIWSLVGVGMIEGIFEISKAN
ncbi:MAG: hypothetical protein DRP27_01080 [Thermotogae bacterium]|nr:MAG: hypothetical protein DRP27_01080 [Thermotogota bacterium]